MCSGFVFLLILHAPLLSLMLGLTGGEAPKSHGRDVKNVYGSKPFLRCTGSLL